MLVLVVLVAVQSGLVWLPSQGDFFNPSGLVRRFFQLAWSRRFFQQGDFFDWWGGGFFNSHLRGFF